MDGAIALLVAITFSFIGALLHEADMADNYKKCGDAKAWFSEIKNDCVDTLGEK